MSILIGLIILKYFGPEGKPSKFTAESSPIYVGYTLQIRVSNLFIPVPSEAPFHLPTMTKNTDERSSGGDHHKNQLKKKKNVSRLGGSGLSLAAFAKAKSRNNNYNPAIISTQFSLLFLFASSHFILTLFHSV